MFGFGNKNKNTAAKVQYGTFANKSGIRKTRRVLTTAFLAVVFITGIGIAIFKYTTQETKQSQVTPAVVTGIPGWWFQEYFGYSVCEKEICMPQSDPDKDKLNNAQEFFYHSHPMNSHTIKDELNDGELVAAGFDPSRPGRMTFDEIISDDNILSESLVFNSDIKQLINESIDPNKIVTPEIPDSRLKIINDNSETTIKKYLTDINEVLKQNLPTNSGNYIESAIKSGGDISDLKFSLFKVSAEMLNIPVPKDFVQLHKYTINLYQILPDVISTPSDNVLSDPENPIANKWYDKTQVAFSLYQKISLESNRLENTYNYAK